MLGLRITPAGLLADESDRMERVVDVDVDIGEEAMFAEGVIEGSTSSSKGQPAQTTNVLAGVVLDRRCEDDEETAVVNSLLPVSRKAP